MAVAYRMPALKNKKSRLVATRRLLTKLSVVDLSAVALLSLGADDAVEDLAYGETKFYFSEFYGWIFYITQKL